MTEKNEIAEVQKNRAIGSFYTSLQNFEDGQRVGNMISQSSMIPAAYKNSLPVVQERSVPLAGFRLYVS